VNDDMHNPIGIISMQYQRPFGVEHFDQLRRWRQAGFDFVEFLVPEPGELDLLELRRALKEAGLTAVVTARLNAERNLVGTEPAMRKTGVDYLKYCVDVAAELGAASVTGPLFGSPLVFAGQAPRSIAEDLRRARVDWCVEGLKAVARHAEGSGIRLAVEPLNRFETDFLNTAGQGVELVRLVDHPLVGLSLDTFHMNMEEDDLPQAFRAAGPHLFHVQANENHRGYLGTGHIHWTSIVHTLNEIDYRGTITLEPFRRTDDRIGIPFAQWKPPGHDEQAELTASCGFIRNLIALSRTRT
jgi:D-psicose/D-tagatose/L-ribulose 3-epimerase